MEPIPRRILYTHTIHSIIEKLLTIEITEENFTAA